MRNVRRRSRVAMFAVLTIAAIAPQVGHVGHADGPAPDHHRYEPLTPCRLADQRIDLGLRVVDRHVGRIDVVGAGCGIPAEAVAIQATLTIDRPSSPGFVTAFATGTPRPTVAQLNYEPGAIRANSAIIPVGDDGRVDLYRLDGYETGGGLIVDVVGAYVPSGPTSAGRLVTPPAATRLVDTRHDDRNPLADRTTIGIERPGSVPPDAIALVVSIIAADSQGPGFVTAWESGGARPNASVLNVDGPGQTRAVTTIVPLGTDGIEVFLFRSAHLIVDMTGWITGAQHESSTDGLFVPVTPTRLRDTRHEPQPINDRGTIGVPFDAAVASLATSITMVRPHRRTHIVVHPVGVALPETSNGNAGPGEIVAMFNVTATSDAGLAVHAHHAVDVTIDVFGYFVGPPAEPDGSPPATNPPARQRVLTIGDSSHAGIERNGAFDAVRGARFDVRGQTCRRLVRPSCDLLGTGPAPTTLEVLQATPFGSYDVLVVQTGYNDQINTFESHVRQVLTEARATGFRRIIWIAHSREFRSDLGGASAFQVYHDHNEVLRRLASEAREIHLVEWGRLARQRSEWLYADGIHLRRAGGFALADTMSRAVAHVTGQPCPLPREPGGATEGRCPDPSGQPPVDVSVLYDLSAFIAPCVVEGPRNEIVCRWDHG